MLTCGSFKISVFFEQHSGQVSTLQIETSRRTLLSQTSPIGRPDAWPPLKNERRIALRQAEPVSGKGVQSFFGLFFPPPGPSEFHAVMHISDRWVKGSTFLAILVKNLSASLACSSWLGNTWSNSGAEYGAALCQEARRLLTQPGQNMRRNCNIT